MVPIETDMMINNNEKKVKRQTRIMNFGNDATFCLRCSNFMNLFDRHQVQQNKWNLSSEQLEGQFFWSSSQQGKNSSFINLNHLNHS